MTIRFRLEAVTLDTTGGEVVYRFPSDLTVLAGPTGVGKTTLLEVIKYGFGGDGLLAPVVEQDINSVTLDVTVGESHLRLSRSIDSGRRSTVRVADLTTRERLPDHHVDRKKPSLSTLLLGALGLPDGMRAAARTGGSSNAGAAITFADLFSFLYIAQSEINGDIARSKDSYLDPKRKAVFELLFGLTNADILAMRSEVNTLNGEIAVAGKEHDTVLAFLRNSNTASREEAERAASAAFAVEELAESDLEALRNAINPVTDRETQTLRDLLTEAETGLAVARGAVTAIARQQTDYTSERRRVQGDLDRLHRMRDASERLASIEFSVCPRCMQSLANREVPLSSCRLCLQDEIVDDRTDGETDQYEAHQLASQLEEIDDQILVLAEQFEATLQTVVDREKLVQRISGDVDDRTADRVSPRLQVFRDAADRLATSHARQESLELVLRQWDRADDLGAATERLRTDQNRIRSAIAESLADLDTRRREILSSLSEEFERTVRNLDIPGVKTASIHPSSYLPLLNGKSFVTFSRGGGIITATQVAYWTSLLTVALRRNDTFYPGFLIIDSPRLALNTDEALSGALYRRLTTLAGVTPGRVQFIIADNELPAAYRRNYAEIDFTYDNPTVSTVRHPGLTNVQTIDTAVNDGETR